LDKNKKPIVPAMENDIEAIIPALELRGFRWPDDFCIPGQDPCDRQKFHRGPLDRGEVLRFLSDCAREISNREAGEVFLYVTGHGMFEGEDPHTARLAVYLDPANRSLSEAGVFWDELLETVSVPDHIPLVILPDT
jgi:hypothetical protein